MMQLNIPRGIIYHSLFQNFSSFVSALFKPLDNRKLVKKFERKFADYLGCKYGLAFPFARIAIYYSLKLKKYPAGTEIIMPPITIKAILDVVLDLGLKPVFVDIDRDTLGFDINKLASAITVNTKAILITYLYGMVPDLDPMIDLCKANHLYVIEDFSQCLNGEYKNKKVGSFGDVGVYSSSSIKTLDTYGGGLLVTNDTDLYHQLCEYQEELIAPSRSALIKKILINTIRNMATTRLIFHLFTFPLLKIVSSFKPQTYARNLGERDRTPIRQLPAAWFTRYTSLQAKVGLSLLSKVQYEDEVRIHNSNEIRESVAFMFPRGAKDTRNVFWQTIAYFSEPSAALKLLRNSKIDSATTSLVKISTLPKYSFMGHTPNADMVYENALFIPAYPGLSNQDIKHIIVTLNNIYQSQM